MKKLASILAVTLAAGVLLQDADLLPEALQRTALQTVERQ